MSTWATEIKTLCYKYGDLIRDRRSTVAECGILNDKVYVFPEHIDRIYTYSLYQKDLCIVHVTFKGAISYIGDYAFYNTNNMESCTFEQPNAITTVGASAFRFCYELKKLVLGNSVESIGNYAFLLAGVRSTAGTAGPTFTLILPTVTPPTLGSTAFSLIDLTNGLFIYVPDESVEDYKAATNWNNYADYIYPLSEYDESE